MGFPEVNTEECIACEACFDLCPFDAINFENGTSKINNEKCSNCRVCIIVCPVGAIR
jgi:Fe-S-cluster-containing hydrogenase component 2